MTDIILPKSKSETGGKENWEKVIIPDSMSQKEQSKLYPDFFNKFSSKIKDLESDVVDIKKEIDKNNAIIREQSSKNIEIIGIFSAILALLIIDVSIIKSAESFLPAILLVISLTCSISIFAVLIHSFFSSSSENKLKTKHFWIPMVILILLTIIGIVSFIFKWSWSMWKS